MPSLLSHPAVPLAFYPLLRGRPHASRLLALGVIGSVVPDADTLGFALGIRYGDLLGHRGLSHSLAFAVTLTLLLARLGLPAGQSPRDHRIACGFLLVAVASHGLLDACTSGGLGVAFFSPFSNHRFFFAFRPILVSPIGIVEFFGSRGVQILASELCWIWAPAAAVALLGAAIRSGRRAAA